MKNDTTNDPKTYPKTDLPMLFYQALQPGLLGVFKIFIFALKLASHFSLSLQQKTRKLTQTLDIRKVKGSEGPAFEAIDPKVFEGRSPLWIHAASGEFEYAKPLIRELTERDSSIKILVTYFSPTYAEAVRKFPGVTASVPLPLDSSTEIAKFLERFQPKCLLIARTDAWPNTVFETARKNIPSLLFSTTFHDQSKRVSFFAKALTRSTLSRLTHIQCVNTDDREALESLGIKSVEIAGDTRYDQVLKRLAAPKSPHVLAQIEAIKSVLHPRSFIAGSVWAEDLGPVLSAFQRLTASDTNSVTLILVPHEVSEGFVRKIEADLSKISIPKDRIARLSRISNARAPIDVLIVDTVGLLAELYLLSDVAFVGGSFRGSVHSVMEPLAAGCVTLVGPDHLNNREAIEFQKVIAIEASPESPAITAVTAVSNEMEFSQTLTSIFDALHDSTDATRNSSDTISADIVAAVRARGGATEKVIRWLKSKKLV